MPRTSSSRRGTSTSRSTSKRGMDAKDARITAAGLLQSIIASGAPPEEWEARLTFAARMHANMTNRLMCVEKKPFPKWDKE